MQILTSQDERLIEELKRAAIREPAQTTSTVAVMIQVLALPLTILRALFWGPPPIVRIGIPHGVENLQVRIKGLRVDQSRRTLYYCESSECVTTDPVPNDDGVPYPSEVRTEMDDELPRSGFYDGLLRVSVNGAVTVKVEKLELVEAL